MKKYQSEIAKSVHEDAEGFYRLGLIDAKRMHEYDVECLVPSVVPRRETVFAGTSDTLRSPIPAVAAPRT